MARKIAPVRRIICATPQYFQQWGIPQTPADLIKHICHINVDLTPALCGCIPPADYGNMLVFVNHGSLAALVRLCGRALGAVEAMLQQVAALLLDLEVKAWRNAAFESLCNAPVQSVEASFG